LEGAIVRKDGRMGGVGAVLELRLSFGGEFYRGIGGCGLRQWVAVLGVGSLGGLACLGGGVAR